MSISHRKAFDLWVKGLDARLHYGTGELREDRLSEEALLGLDGEERRQLASHLPGCPECMGDLSLALHLRKELRLHWLSQSEPSRPVGELLQAIQNRQQANARVDWVFASVRAALIVLALAGGILALSWILNFLRPEPIALPITSPTTILSSPTPEPTFQPTQTAAPILEKTPIQPAIPAGLLGLVGWSPDSRYLLMVQTTLPNEQVSDRMYTSISIYDTHTGQSCPAGAPVLGSAYGGEKLAWMPDGRLLAVSPKDVTIYTPCSPEMETITALFEEPVQSVYGNNGNNPFLILAGKTSFWLYDTTAHSAARLEGVKPVEGWLNRVFWSPSGREAAFSQPAEAGSRVILMDLQTRQILEQIPISAGTTENQAWIDWINEDSLLIYGGQNQRSLLIKRQPGSSSVVIPAWKDLTDLATPGMVSAEGSFGDPQSGIYHLMLAYDTPEKRYIFLYHSDGDRIETLAHEINTILLFPDGQSIILNILENTPAYNDRFQVIWVDDTTRESSQIQVMGHTPRQYPQLIDAWDAKTGDMAFGSTQGVSLISLEDGRLVEFWKLAGQEPSYTGLSLSPDGKTLAVHAQTGTGSRYGVMGEIYLIPLP